MATAAIKPRAEAACRLCRGEAVKAKGQSSLLFLIEKRKIVAVAMLLRNDDLFLS